MALFLPFWNELGNFIVSYLTNCHFLYKTRSLWANTALRNNHFDNMLRNERNLGQSVIKTKSWMVLFFTKCHNDTDLTIKMKENLLVMYQYAVTLHSKTQRQAAPHQSKRALIAFGLHCHSIVNWQNDIPTRGVFYY